MDKERTGVKVVASLMALSARTAPKAKGMDSLAICIAEGSDIEVLSTAMKTYGHDHSIPFFLRDGNNVSIADACLLLGVRGQEPVGINCKGCGYNSCNDMTAGWQSCDRNPAPFAGPNCVVKITDLGIAVGSAVRTASLHNVDNRVMYSAGVAALLLGWLPECSVAYGIPLKASGKNIFFDRS